MLDVLPPASKRWERVVGVFADRARRYDYGLLLTPIVEHYEVFARVGETSDVVRKELYDFVDRGDRRLALRPEGTASVVRAFVQHRPVAPWKVWYVAPNFRAEAPQAGRYRQHWQLGVEVLGVDDPAVDVEVIALAHGFYRSLGLARFRLLVNSMGDTESRALYRDVLLAYWHRHADLIGAEMERAEANPLRILDAKRPDWAEMIAGAPLMADYLTPESAEQFAAVQEGLRALGIEFEVAPRLVRGLDYYTGTTFEFASAALEAAQNAIGGGGRYDRLAEEMGGPATPGIGFGIGIERVLIACDAEDVFGEPETHLDVFVVDLVGGVEPTVLIEELRAAGFSADRAFGARSAKKQWAAADKSGAEFGVLVAPRELEGGAVAVKDLASGEQVEVKRTELVSWLQSRKDTASP